MWGEHAIGAINSGNKICDGDVPYMRRKHLFGMLRKMQTQAARKQPNRVEIR